jgi:hypothetical protein
MVEINPYENKFIEIGTASLISGCSSIANKTVSPCCTLAASLSFFAIAHFLEKYNYKAYLTEKTRFALSLLSAVVLTKHIYGFIYGTAPASAGLMTAAAIAVFAGQFIAKWLRKPLIEANAKSDQIANQLKDQMQLHHALVASLANDKEQMKKELQSKQQQIASLLNDNAQMQKQLQYNRSNIDSLTAECHELGLRNRELDKVRLDYTKAKNASEQQLQDKESQMIIMQVELFSLRKQVSELKKALPTSQSTFF